MAAIDRNLDQPPRVEIDQTELERQKAAFFKRGGKVQQIPIGVTAATAQTAGRTHSKKQKIKIEEGEF